MKPKNKPKAPKVTKVTKITKAKPKKPTKAEWNKAYTQEVAKLPTSVNAKERVAIATAKANRKVGPK
jgi:hypothetical protein